MVYETKKLVAFSSALVAPLRFWLVSVGTQWVAILPEKHNRLDAVAFAPRSATMCEAKSSRELDFGTLCPQRYM